MFLTYSANKSGGFFLVCLHEKAYTCGERLEFGPEIGIQDMAGRITDISTDGMENQVGLQIDADFLLMNVLVKQFDCITFGIFVVGFHAAVGIDAEFRPYAE